MTIGGNMIVRPYRVVRIIHIQGGGEDELVVKSAYTDADIKKIKCWTVDDLGLDPAELRKGMEERVAYLERHGKVFQKVTWEIQTLPKSGKWALASDLMI
jgi:hypothetical protein